MRPVFILATFILLLITGACGKGKAQIDTEILVPSQAVAVPSQMDALPAPTGEELAIARRELAALDIPDGVGSDAWQQLCDALLDSMQNRSTSKLPNESRNVIDDLQWIDNGGGDFSLEWTFRNAGDYDNNGEVNVSDLSAIGVHFGKNESSSSWASAQTADGDGNGEINIADVSPIGVNFGSQVLGYNVYASNFEDGPWLLVGSIELADATTGFPRKFSYAYGAQGHAFVTVAPFDSTDEDSIANSGGTAAKFIPGTTTEQTSQAIDFGGGQLVGSGGLDGIVVDIPVGALDRSEMITLGSNDGMLLPVDGTWGGTIIDISGPNPILFEKPVIITAPFSGDPDVVPVPYYIRDDGKLEACILTDMDRSSGTFSFATEHTSEYTWVLTLPDDGSGEYRAPGYSPGTSGFNIVNRGSDYNIGGECLGMTSFSQWYYRYGPKELPLYTRFLESLGTDSDGKPILGQDVIATRAFNTVVESQINWLKSGPKPGTVRDQITAIKHVIRNTSAPTNVSLIYGYKDGHFVDGHAVLAYGYTQDRLLVYDPNHPGVSLKIDIVGDGFYYEFGEHYDSIFCFGTGTLARESFEAILADAEAGFRGSEDALISNLNHEDNDTVTEPQITLTGTISSSEVLVERLKVVNEDQTSEVPVDTVGGFFSIQVPIKDGDNLLTFITEGRNGFNNWVETPNNYTGRGGLKLVGDIPPDKLRITLTWDQNNSFGMFVKDPSGQWDPGTRIGNHDMSLVTDAGGRYEGSYEGGGPLYFVIPHDGTLAAGPYQIRVINTSTVEDHGVVPANWQLTVSFNEGEPLTFSGSISEGNISQFPSAWSEDPVPGFSQIYVVNYE
ncbi:hypothetical protein KDL29_15360 [bacterium]|nr:hypothetical protein [bacterium]